MHELKIINKESDTETVLHVSKESVETIVIWYGAFAVGDDYSVYLDGKELQLDHNGELVNKI